MSRLLVIVLMLLSGASSAVAGVMASSTRIIYPAGEREKSLMLVNTNSYPVIVQSWVDDGIGNPDTAKAPFIVIPPVFRLVPQGIQGIRLMFNQTTIPQDRESVFWLNLYEVPPTNGAVPDVQRVTLAMNTQMKIFYRPQTLTISLEEALPKLLFRLRHDKERWWIECENPTPLHVSLTSITVQDGAVGRSVEQQMDMMVGPFSKKNYAIFGTLGSEGKHQIRFHYLDDAGEQHLKDAILQEAG